jgi:hypothetical protein
MRGRSRALVAGAVVLALVAGTVAYLVTRSSGTPAASHPAGTTPSSTPSAVPAGYLITSGTRIVDSSGNVVQLQGYNVTGMESTNPQGSNIRGGACNAGWRPLTAAEVGQIAAYGFNSVRLPISWGNLEPTAPTSDGSDSLTHHWNTEYIAALDSEITQLGDARLKVILDMHQSSWGPAFSTPQTAKRPGCPGSGMPTWLNPQAAQETAQTAACDFYAGRTEPGVPGTGWADFTAAESYVDGHFAGNSTVVAQDIVNEPYCGRASTNLNGFYDLVTPALHRANPNILLMLEDRETPGSFKVSSPPPVPNIVLSVHLHEDYWSAPTAGQSPLPFSGQAALAADLQRATQWNVPLYVGEFYAFDATGNQNGNKQSDQNWQADTAAFLKYAKDNNIGWTYWAWIQKSDPTVQPEITAAVQAALRNG